MPDWGKWLGRLKKRKVHTPPSRPEATSDLSTTVGNGLNVALRLLKEAVTGIGVPGLEAAVNGVVGVIDLVGDVRDNASNLGDLSGLISSLANTISRSPDLHQKEDVPESLRTRIDAFLSELHGMLIEVQQMLDDTNVVSRTANSRAHKDSIEDINARISRLLGRFFAEGILSLELNMAGARQDIRSVGKAVAFTQEHLVVTQNAQEYEKLINAIPRVHARYNDTSTKPTRPCHPGTRTGLLQIIRMWLDEDLDATPYFWLCGEVGVGKSTVAHTIAQEQEALERLGASFFFSRHDDSRRAPHLLFPSIAYQLARFDPGFYNALAKALKPDPDVVERSLTEQFKRLVLQPLAQSGISPSRTVVIVIDGLDECTDPASILDVLTLGIGDVGIRLRVLISSRPYSAILSKFEDSRLCHLTSSTKFRDIDHETLSNDVTIYLTWSLGDLAFRRRLPSPWPPKEQLDELIRRAAGLFIIASTYTKYIEDPEEGNPVGQLARILSMRRGEGSSPLAELDALYDQVLDDLKLKLPLKINIAREIIATVILAPQSINVLALAGLLCVNPYDVRSVLRRLTAVILLPEGDDGNIIPFHASFGEYIRDSTRCTIYDFSVDDGVAYGRIVVRSFDATVSVAKDGITGVEYDCARGDAWTPEPLRHIVDHLAFYLSHCPAAQVEEVKATFNETTIWTLLNLGFIWQDNHSRIELLDAAGGFKPLPRIEEFSDDQERRGASLARLMLANHVSEINRLAQNTLTAHHDIAVGALEHNQLQDLKFRVSSGPEIALVCEWSGNCPRNCPPRVHVKFDDDDIPEDPVLVHVVMPTNVQCSSSLHEYLKRNKEIDAKARVRIALSVADGLCCLHGSFPPQPHNGINHHQIMISEGQPFLYPSCWKLGLQSGPLPNDNQDVDETLCYWRDDSHPKDWYHWNPSGNEQWQRSLEARLQLDVWDFGSMLFLVITGEEPLTTWDRLAQGNEILGYDAEEGNVPHTYWEDESSDKSRYDAAVSFLLDTLQASQDIKGLLKSCWTIRPEDRPRMSEVFARMKEIVQAMET